MGHFNIVHSEPLTFTAVFPHVAEMTKDVPVDAISTGTDALTIGLISIVILTAAALGMLMRR